MLQRAKRADKTKAPKLKVESYATLITRAFEGMADMTENGIRSRTTVFSAIYKKLLHQEIAGGDRSAFRARLAYDKFARERQPEESPEIVIVHEGKTYEVPRR